MLQAIPALPVTEIVRSVDFYRDKLGCAALHQETAFAIVRRDVMTIHLWAASDQSWRQRSGSAPVLSGAESFIAGTASCQVVVEGLDEWYRMLRPLGILHPNGQLHDTPWGTREFGVLDPDHNLLTFVERK